MDLAAIAGTLGGILSVCAFLPQAYRIIQRRSATDVSLTMYVAIVVGCVLWMYYAYALGSLQLFLTNLIILLIALLIVVLRVLFGKE